MMPLNEASCSWLTVQNRQHLPKRVHASLSRITAHEIHNGSLPRLDLPCHAKKEEIKSCATHSENICHAKINNLEKRNFFVTR